MSEAGFVNDWTFVINFFLSVGLSKQSCRTNQHILENICYSNEWPPGGAITQDDECLRLTLKASVAEALLTLLILNIYSHSLIG